MDVDPSMVARVHHIIPPLAEISQLHHKLVKFSLRRWIGVRPQINEAREENVSSIQSLAVFEIIREDARSLTIPSRQKLQHFVHSALKVLEPDDEASKLMIGGIGCHGRDLTGGYQYGMLPR